MPEPTRRKAKISAFALAAKSNSIAAEVGLDDVMHSLPHLSREEAIRFLDRHAGEIGAAMLIAALQTMRRIGEGGDEYVQ